MDSDTPIAQIDTPVAISDTVINFKYQIQKNFLYFAIRFSL